jgi:hypothetical protein
MAMARVTRPSSPASASLAARGRLAVACRRCAFLIASAREEGKLDGQGRAFPRELLPGGDVAHVEPDALEQLLDLQSRLVADLH